jgi:transposase
LIAGEADPERLADLLQSKLKHKLAQVVEALRGRPTVHHRALLKLHLGLVETLEGAIEDLNRQIAEAVASFRELIERLDRMPGISEVVAPAVVAEVGLDMTRFPSHRNLLSWACLCPRLDQCADKVHSTRLARAQSATALAIAFIAFTFVESLLSVPQSGLMVYDHYRAVLASRLLALLTVPLVLVLLPRFGLLVSRWPSASSA